MNQKVLSEYGVCYEKGLARCMGDVEFYSSLLSLFLKDDTFERAKEAFGRRDYSALFKCMHELKGICGNIDMTELYAAVCRLVELLRHDGGTDVEIARLFAQTEAAYVRAVRGVSLALDA